MLYGLLLCKSARCFAPDKSYTQKDVLWVRFCEEDTLFDYEQLSAFTYHPMEGGGAAVLLDKYIKGQEYSVVVIEGLPAVALSATVTANPEEEELKMWQARRELYLCASRANVFLFFVLKVGAPGEQEVESLLSNLRMPNDSRRRLWRLTFNEGQPSRRISVLDGIDEGDEKVLSPNPIPSIVTLRMTRPVSIRALVANLQIARGLSD